MNVVLNSGCIIQSPKRWSKSQVQRVAKNWNYRYLSSFCSIGLQRHFSYKLWSCEKWTPIGMCPIRSILKGVSMTSVGEIEGAEVTLWNFYPSSKLHIFNWLPFHWLAVSFWYVLVMAMWKRTLIGMCLKWRILSRTGKIGSGKITKYFFLLLGLKYNLRTCFESKNFLSNSCPELSNQQLSFSACQVY